MGFKENVEQLCKVKVYVQISQRCNFSFIGQRHCLLDSHSHDPHVIGLVWILYPTMSVKYWLNEKLFSTAEKFVEWIRVFTGVLRFFLHSNQILLQDAGLRKLDEMAKNCFFYCFWIIRNFLLFDGGEEGRSFVEKSISRRNCNSIRSNFY